MVSLPLEQIRTISVNVRIGRVVYKDLVPAVAALAAVETVAAAEAVAAVEAVTAAEAVAAVGAYTQSRMDYGSSTQP